MSIRCRSLLLVAALLLVVPTLPLSAVADAPPAPTLDAADDPTALLYRVEATAAVAYAARTVTLDETLTLTNPTATTFDSVTLLSFPRAVGAWSEELITVNGLPVTPTYPTDLALRLPLDPPLAAGGSATVVVHGLISLTHSTDTMGRLGTKGKFIALGDWLALPGRAVARSLIGDSMSPSAASLIRMTITTDVTMQAAAVQGSGTATLLPATSGKQWIFEQVNARAAAVGINPDFVQVKGSESTSGISIVAASTSGSRASAMLADAKSAVASYTAWFGLPAYTRLRVVESSYLSYSQEYPALVLIGDNGSAGSTRRTYLVRHEVAHQWWYGLSVNHQLDAAWADEAFAEFAARLKAGSNPSSCSTSKIDLFPDTYKVFSGSCTAYWESVYLRGTRMLWAIKTKIGQNKLLTCLRNDLQAHRFAPVSGAALADVLEACDPAVRAIIAPYLSTTTLDPTP